MKTRSYGVALLPVVVALVAGTLLSTLHPGIARAANCIPNVDGFGHSAAVVNPVTFSGPLNATGCDFGIFVTEDHFSTITHATIVGASTAIDVDFDATANVSLSTLQSMESGIVLGDVGPGHGVISGNTITYGNMNLATCGICVQHAGSTATIMNNTITSLVGVLSSGIVGSGASSITISNNTLLRNPGGINLAPPAGSGYTVTDNLTKDSQVGIKIQGGTGSVISTNRVEVGTPQGVNTGIWDFLGATNDQIVSNFICAYATPINTTGAINPIVVGNVIQATCP